jgi:hypothetical protein
MPPTLNGHLVQMVSSETTDLRPTYGTRRVDLPPEYGGCRNARFGGHRLLGNASGMNLVPSWWFSTACRAVTGSDTDRS